MSPEVVALEGVVKRYGDRAALSEVSFTLCAGEAVGYLGPNGAGKTTTLKLLSGLLRPDSGRVRILGRDPNLHGGAALALVGALLETPGIAPYLHGRDLLDYVAEIKGIPGAGRAAEVRRAGDVLGVTDHLDRPVGSLSTGLLRRLWIAGALIGDPEVLLLDEPTLGLDPVARRDLRTTLRKLRGDGTTLLVSTHLLDDVEEVCDRVLFLRDGRLVGDEPTHPGSDGPDGPIPRRFRLRFLAPVPLEPLQRLLEPGEALEDSEGVEITLVHRGGDARQAALLAAVLRAGLPLVSARPLGDGLTDRYLAAVGREDDP